MTAEPSAYKRLLRGMFCFPSSSFTDSRLKIVAKHNERLVNIAVSGLASYKCICSQNVLNTPDLIHENTVHDVIN